MNEIGAWFSVMVAGILELWVAIPLGFTLKLPPVLTAIWSAVGSIAAAAIIIFFGKSIRSWLVRRFQQKNERKETTMSRIWRKYGIIGLGFLSPLITGAPLGAAIGVSFGAKPGKLMLWMTIGIAFWSAVLTAAAAFGIMTLT
ncbi:MULTISPECIES: small multi-drug export protein [Paenibacillus]|uniref:Small multi-drug export protein n=1 Tax=Paenibacillus radicis (ex Xue et al. 2023) TaxID=2972489 RepID=A0ABT1YCH1_9BACL|nr:small multi-drug export protein [Paenibacillus radicis (ex Xue et al. 2023)]MCR8629908.1 small multi-drug export protein [Paenibacillus radicis (ex Xue et al. 2023)]